jgi:hypothetical protein
VCLTKSGVPVIMVVNQEVIYSEWPGVDCDACCACWDSLQIARIKHGGG